MSQNLSAQTAPLRTAGAEFAMPLTSIRKVEADGVQVFYRAAGDPSAPVVLLLHGFPASSFMFRELIPRLADRYRVIAPDLPGFGFTEVPAERKYTYSFDAIGRDDRSLHGSTQNQTLCTLRVRLWRADGLPSGDGSPRTSHCDRFTERERVRRGSW